MLVPHVNSTECPTGANAMGLFLYINIVGHGPSRFLVYLNYTVFCKLNVLPSSGVRGKDPLQLGPFEGAGLGHWARLVHLQVMPLIYIMFFISSQIL
jgi:hypothetical protein